MRNNRLYINSKDRSYGTSHSFSFSIQPGVPNATRFSIGDIQIPRTYYNINANNNSFEFVDSASSTHIIPLDLANVDITTFIASLEVSMNAVSADVHTITYIASTGKLTFTTTGASMTLLFGSGTARMVRLGDLLGFRDTDISGASIEGQRVIAFAGTRTVKIACSQVNIPSFFQGTPNYAILASIPVTADFGGMIIKGQELGFHGSYNASTDGHSSFNVRLLDDYGDTLDLNGVDWEMYLIFR